MLKTKVGICQHILKSFSFLSTQSLSVTFYLISYSMDARGEESLGHALLYSFDFQNCAGRS